jgi:hypothetical protein
MLNVITDPDETATAVATLTQVIVDAADSSSHRTWSFPSGHKGSLVTRSLLQGKMLVATDDWGTRIAHLISLSGEEDPLVPDVEINVPKRHARGIAGVLATGERAGGAQLHLLHRGSANIFRGPIPKDRTLEAFADLVEHCQDRDKSTPLIYVASLSVADMGQSLYDFATRMRAHKSAVRAEREAGEADPAVTRDAL